MDPGMCVQNVMMGQVIVRDIVRIVGEFIGVTGVRSPYLSVVNALQLVNEAGQGK